MLLHMQTLRAMAAAVLLLVPMATWAADEPVVPIPKLRGSTVEIVPEQKAPRRAIRFLTSSDYPPFQFLKPDLNPAGFNVDLARAICDELDYSCTIQALNWDELLPALESGKTDAIIAGLRPSADLRGKAGLTRPYFRLPGRFVVKTGGTPPPMTPEGLAGKKVAVVAGTAHEAFLKTYFPEAEVTGFPDMEQARTALKDSKADALFADGVSLSLWLSGTESADCCAFAGGPYYESHFFGEGLVVAVRKSDNRLRQDIDRALDGVEEKGGLADLYLRWFPVGIF